MTPTLSVAVMAHPSRTEMVVDLLGRLDRPAPVVWDRINDRHDTGIRSMEAFDPACTHHLVVQDDVVPCVDLIAGAERALRHVPQDVPVSLYLGRVKPFGKAVENVTRRADDASWITMEGVYWGPAIIVPTSTIEAMSKWFRGSNVTNYDRRLSKWFQLTHRRTSYTWPSLVEHRGEESLIRRSKAIRNAHRFIGADASGLDVDWSGPVADMTNTDRLDRRRQRSAPAPRMEVA